MKNQVILTNRATAKLCNDNVRNNRQIFPYFHLYVNSNVFDDDGDNNAGMVFDVLSKGITSQNEYNNYSGIAITFTDYEKIVKAHNFEQLKNLIVEIVNLGQSHFPYLPVLLPRSGWFGLYFTDLGIQAFSSLLNGNPKYSSGGGDIDEDDKFGKIPVIEKCIDVGINWVKRHLSDYDEFPRVEGLPISRARMLERSTIIPYQMVKTNEIDTC